MNFKELVFNFSISSKQLQLKASNKVRMGPVKELIT